MRSQPSVIALAVARARARTAAARAGSASATPPPACLRAASSKVIVHATNSQSAPAVASDANGNFLVAWQSFGQDGSSLPRARPAASSG
jgi:hypothetical protein